MNFDEISARMEYHLDLEKRDNFIHQYWYRSSYLHRTAEGLNFNPCQQTFNDRMEKIKQNKNAGHFRVGKYKKEDVPKISDEEETE